MLSIAVGVFLGGLALYLTIEWMKRRAKLRAARKLGEEAGDALANAIAEAVADEMVAFQVGYWPVLETRIGEHVAEAAESHDREWLRQEALAEVAALVRSVRDQADDSLRRCEERAAEWMALVDPRDIPTIRDSIRQHIHTQTETLYLNAMLRTGELLEAAADVVPEKAAR